MRIEWVLRRQAGVLTLAQALAAGLSERTVQYRVRTGRWHRLFPGIYLAGGEPSDEAAVWAAVLWAGRDAALSGPAAAWWHGLLPAPPVAMEVTVPRGRAPSSRGAVRVRRRNLSLADLVEIRGLTTTALPLTVLETAPVLGEHGPEFLDRALQRVVSYPTLCRAHSRNLGRRGSAAAGQMLAVAGDCVASRAERLLIGLLRVAGVAGWTTQYAVAGYRVDLAFPASRLAVEVDGWAWHSDTARFRSDRVRQNALVLAGWTVLRFTWHDLTARPADVIAEIRRALAQARAS